MNILGDVKGISKFNFICLTFLVWPLKNVKLPVWFAFVDDIIFLLDSATPGCAYFPEQPHFFSVNLT